MKDWSAKKQPERADIFKMWVYNWDISETFITKHTD